MTLQPLTSNSCVYNQLTYGDYTFNGFAKSNVKIDAIQSEDTTTVKYMKLTFEVELVITNETVHRATSYYKAADSELSNPISNPTPKAGIDGEMEQIRNTLTTPGLYFDLSYRGFGEDPLRVDPTIREDTDTKDSSLNVPDLVSGPFPKVISWEPISGNQAGLIRWQVEVMYLKGDRSTVAKLLTRAIFPPTYRDQNREDSYDNNKYFDYLVSFVEEQEISINEEGALTLATIGTIELAGNAGYMHIEGNLHVDPQSTAPEDRWFTITREFERHLVKMFQTTTPLGFHRKNKVRFNKDNRRINYVIEDTEIPSDNALMPYIIRAEVSHEIESNLLSKNVFSGSGFATWGNTFTGSFTVKPGYWKGLAWFALLLCVNQRRSLCKSLADEDPKYLKTLEDSAFTDKLSDDKKLNKKQVTYYIKIKEDIYKRTVTIVMKYMTVHTLEQVIEATGMFTPIHNSWLDYTFTNDAFPFVGENPSVPVKALAAGKALGSVPNIPKTPLTNKEQWAGWSSSIRSIQNVFGYRDVSLPDVSLIFNPNISGNNPSNIQNATIDINGRTNEGIPVNNPPYSLGPASPYTAEQFAKSRKYQNYIGKGVNFQNSSLLTSINMYPDEAAQPGESGIKALLGTASKGDAANLPGNQLSTYFNDMTPSESWVNYDNTMELIEQSNSVYLPTLLSQASSTRHTDDVTMANAKKDKYGLGINNTSNNAALTQGDYSSHSVQAFGAPTYIVRMRGSAIRAGWAIPMPSVAGAYNQNFNSMSEPNLIKAYRIGSPRWKHIQITRSADIPIYMAMWEIDYALQGDPTCVNIAFKSTDNAYYA
jgi:hypothetical protein